MFDSVNTLLQKDEPCIHILHSVLLNLLRDVLVKFIRPISITAAANMTEILYKEEANHKAADDIFIGSKTLQFIKDNATVLAPRLPQFYDSVKRYYMTACDYMIKKFPFNDPVLINAEVASICNRQSHSFNQLKYFTDRFSCLLPMNMSETVDTTLDSLQNEFNSYQVTVLPDSCMKAKRIDEAWHIISEIKDPVTGLAKFQLLSTVVKGILVIFHSNADCERIFSLVNKNKTEFRPNLSTKTLGSLITRKLMMSAQSQLCHTVHHSKEVLRRAKSSTFLHLSAAADTNQ